MAKFCSNCGAEIEEFDKSCKACGQSLAAQVKKSDRPVVIVIAVIISALYGIIEILLGLLVLVVGLLFQSISKDLGMQNLPPEMPKEFVVLGVVALIGIGLLVLIFGIIDAAVAYGLWKLKKWAGYLGITLNVIGFIISLPFISDIFGVASISLSALTIILIALGWNSLE